MTADALRREDALRLGGIHGGAFICLTALRHLGRLRDGWSGDAEGRVSWFTMSLEHLRGHSVPGWSGRHSGLQRRFTLVHKRPFKLCDTSGASAHKVLYSLAGDTLTFIEEVLARDGQGGPISDATVNECCDCLGYLDLEELNRWGAELDVEYLAVEAVQVKQDGPEGIVRMTVQEAADFVGVVERTMRNWIGPAGKIKASPLQGGLFEFSQAELDAHREAKKAGKERREPSR